MTLGTTRIAAALLVASASAASAQIVNQQPVNAVGGYSSQEATNTGGLGWFSEVADNYLRVEERVRKVSDGVGGLVDTTAKFPVWFDPVAENGTPMRDGHG